MNQRFCTSILLFALLSTVFSSCITARVVQKSNVTIHSVHSMDFIGKATIAGIVVDSEGQALIGASIALFDLDTESLKVEGAVTPDGTYKITNISPDKYRVRVKADGFKTVQFNELNLRANTLVIIDFHLENN
jgi:hypothetical protein